MVALALDGDKKPCRVMTSNAAHCLATGLLDRDQAEALAHRLMADDMFSGWGVRTLSTTASRYNPMSYHNGSVWPHDNAIAALGLARIPGRVGALRHHARDVRLGGRTSWWKLPELFCGSPASRASARCPIPSRAIRKRGPRPASMMLQAILGLRIDGLNAASSSNRRCSPRAWVRS